MTMFDIEDEECQEHPSCVIYYFRRWHPTRRGPRIKEIPGTRQHYTVEPGLQLPVMVRMELEWACPTCGICHTRTVYDPASEPEEMVCLGRSWGCLQQFRIHFQPLSVEILGELTNEEFERRREARWAERKASIEGRVMERRLKKRERAAKRKPKEQRKAGISE